jgi:hypothetical protein
LPAFDIGWPNLWRFSLVSGIGPLVVTVSVTEAPVAVSTAVTEVDVGVPVCAA